MQRRPYSLFVIFHPTHLTAPLSRMKTQTFRKAEHLCRQRDIEALFSAGSHALTAYPLRMVYRATTPGSLPPVQVLLSVAKRRLHHAVDRNRAKRQLREAYRRHKYLLTDALPDGAAWHVAFIWLAEGPIDSRQIDSRMQSLLRRMAERIAADSDRDESRAHHAVSREGSDVSREGRDGSAPNTPAEP